MLKKYFSFCLFLLFSAALFGQSYNMMIRSASVKHLYRQCENPLYFDVSNLCGEVYNPKVVATNADVWQDSALTNKFVIFPKEATTCLLTLYNQKNEGEMKLGEEKVLVSDPPKPEIYYSVNGSQYRENISISRGSRVYLSIKADEDFMNALPQESRYMISEINIYQASCFGAQRVGGASFMGQVVKKEFEIPIPFSTSGNKLYVEIKDIYRVNSKGEWIKDNRFTPYEKTLVFMTK